MTLRPVTRRQHPAYLRMLAAAEALARLPVDHPARAAVLDTSRDPRPALG